MHAFLRRLRVDVRPDESRAAAFLFLYFFLITLTFSVIKTVKESLQISVNPRSWWVFDLGTAVLIGFAVAVNTRLLNRLPRRKYSSLTLGFSAGCLALFWYAFDLYHRRIYPFPVLLVFVQSHLNLFIYAFSFWSDVFIAMTITQFWIAVNDIFHPHQAKRLVGFLVTGGLLGGIAGSAIAWSLPKLVAPHYLLLVCPAILLLMIAVVGLVHGEGERLRGGTEAGSRPAGAGVGFLESLRTVRGDRYLRILAGVLASAVLVGQIINYQFKFVVKAQGWNDATRTSFLAMFFSGVLVVSTLFHLFATGRVLRRFGIRVALLVAPVVLILGTVPVFFLTIVTAAAVPTAAGLLWASLLRGADKLFDTTMSQSVRELLYIPIPAEIKYKAKVLIDMSVNKFALGFGAVLYWTLYRALSFAMKTPEEQVRTLGVFVVAFALLWMGLIWIIHDEYLGKVKADLARKWQDGHKVVDANVDIGLTRRIVDTIQSRERSATLYVMNLYGLVQKEKLTAELMEAIGLRGEELKARSMDALLGVDGEPAFQGIEDIITDKEFDSVVREVMALPVYKDVMEKQIGDLVTGKSASEVARMEAAKALGLMEPTPAVIRELGRLLRDPSPEVLNYALHSAAAHLRKEHVPAIVDLLENPMTRQLAQDTLAAYGPRVEDVLKKRLQDREGPPEVRRAIPDVLARLGNQKAADALVAELVAGDEVLEAGLIEALYKVRANHPQASFKKRRIAAAALSLARRNAEDYLAAAEAGAGREPGPERQAAIDLRTKLLFDLLTLIAPPEDVVKAYQNILRGTKKSVDYSLELLDNILNGDLKELLFPLIESLPPEERCRRLRKPLRAPRPR
ncbi:MAG TPA: Npt1/Npt2 family nucleotide transporter [Terriglobales bacterium]|nr:Npt1/Npt2 family nucleotide transporter [Terriglobales bacterium]